MFMFFEHGVLL